MEGLVLLAVAAIAACNRNCSPCIPNARDVDCAGGQGNSPAHVAGPVKVIGADVSGLRSGWEGDRVRRSLRLRNP